MFVSVSVLFISTTSSSSSALPWAGVVTTLGITLCLVELLLDHLLDAMKLWCRVKKQQVDLTLDLWKHLVVIWLEFNLTDSLLDLTNHCLEHGLSVWLRLRMFNISISTWAFPLLSWLSGFLGGFESIQLSVELADILVDSINNANTIFFVDESGHFLDKGIVEVWQEFLDIANFSLHGIQ